MYIYICMYIHTEGVRQLAPPPASLHWQWLQSHPSWRSSARQRCNTQYINNMYTYIYIYIYKIEGYKWWWWRWWFWWWRYRAPMGSRVGLLSPQNLAIPSCPKDRIRLNITLRHSLRNSVNFEIRSNNILTADVGTLNFGYCLNLISANSSLTATFAP